MEPPNTPEVLDTMPQGTLPTTYRVAMSDGSPFSWKVQFAAPF
jgi:hypothetical protein